MAKQKKFQEMKKEDLNALIAEFQKLDSEKLDIINRNPQFKIEILERLDDFTKKNFMMTVVNINSKINKKFSLNVKENRDIDLFLKNNRLINGFYRFLPEYNKCKEMKINVEKSSIIIQKIIENFVPLLKNIISNNFIKKHNYMKMHFNELYAGGIMGIVSSVYKFDISRDVKFITHAYRWIVYYIHREMDDIVVTYNDKLYDNDSFFDTLESTSSENEIDNISFTVELERIINTDILDSFEREIIKDLLTETISEKDINFTIYKMQAMFNPELRQDLAKQYLSS